MSRFDYVKYDEHAAVQQAVFKESFEELDQMIGELPPGRATALAITKLEECYMWIGKAIRDDQAVRLGKVTLQEERKNG